jgi:hypothetical protein
VAFKGCKGPEFRGPPRAGESTRDALVRVLNHFTRAMELSESGRMLAGLVAEMSHNPELAQAVRTGILEHRRSFVFAILRRGIELGEIREEVDVEIVADMLSGPVVMRVLLTGGAITPRLVRKVIDTILDGIAVRA